MAVATVARPARAQSRPKVRPLGGGRGDPKAGGVVFKNTGWIGGQEGLDVRDSHGRGVGRRLERQAMVFLPRLKQRLVQAPLQVGGAEDVDWFER